MPQVTFRTKFEPEEHGWICQENQLMRVKIDHYHIKFCNVGEHHQENNQRRQSQSVLGIISSMNSPKEEKEDAEPTIDYIVCFDVPGHPLHGQFGQVGEEYIFRNPSALIKHLHRNCESNYNINVPYNPSVKEDKTDNDDKGSSSL